MVQPRMQMLPPTNLCEVEFEFGAVELGLMELDASTSCSLRRTEADPDSPETLKHLERRLIIIDSEQRLKPFLQKYRHRAHRSSQ